MDSNRARFGPAPFWFLNHQLTLEEMKWQVDRFAQMGLGGAVLHSRHGRKTPYLSEEWFNMLEAAIRRGQEYGMIFWLYDEDNWPSGPAGMKTWEGHPEFIMRYLYQADLVIVQSGERVELSLPPCTEVILSTPVDENGEPIDFPARVEEVSWNGDRLIWGAPVGGPKYALYVFATSDVSPWAGFYDRKYLDVINPAAVRHFIEITHEQYAVHLKELLGTSVIGIFTDEPACFYGDPARDVQYTPSLWEEFRRRKGYDLRRCLPALFAHLGETGEKIRIDFYDVVGQLYEESFFQQIYQWCEAHGIKLIGHMLFEGEMPQHVRYQTDFFRNTRWMHWSGVDHLGLGDAYWQAGTQNLLGPKFASSAAHLLGKEAVDSEAFGEVGWTYDLQDLKRLFDSQLALGVNYIIPHAFYYSIQGFRKGECPPDESWRVPFCRRHYSQLAEYIANACRHFSGGRHLGQVGVLFPYRSWWAKIIPGHEGPLNELHGRLEELAKLLSKGGYDWDFLNEELLQSGTIENGTIGIGPEATRERFELIILPDAKYLQEETINMLRRFAEAGGRVILLRCAPDLALGLQYHPEAHVYVCDTLGYELLRKLLPKPNLSLESNAQGKDLVTYSYFKDGSYRFFIFNDGPDPIHFQVRCGGEGNLVQRDLQTDAVHSANLLEDGAVELELAGYQSLLLERNPGLEEAESGEGDKAGDLSKSPSLALAQSSSQVVIQDAAGAPDSSPVTIPFGEEWEIRPEDDNALVLADWRATFKIVGGREEGRGGWHRYFHVFQTSFNVEELPTRCRLLLDGIVAEHVVGTVDKGFELRLNGRVIRGFLRSDVLDHFMYTAEVASHLRKGQNVVELLCAQDFYEGLHIADPLILLGDFGVRGGTIVGLPKTLHTGDWLAQGFPHFAGSIHYRQEIEIPEARKALIHFPAVGDAVEVSVNGHRVGAVCWSPWVLDVTEAIRPGINEFDFAVSNGLANLIALRARPSGLLEAPRVVVIGKGAVE